MGSDSQLKALYVPKGKILWCTLQLAGPAATGTDTPIIGAQGWILLMPKRNNGFSGKGISKFKSVNKGTEKVKTFSSGGSYPSYRDFGTILKPSAIDQYNFDSDWTRWRKGLEYYYQGAYLDYEETSAVLYEDTTFAIPITFSGYRFASKDSENNTRYTIKRSLGNNRSLGQITEVRK